MIPVNYVKLVFLLIYGEGIVNTAVFLTFEPDVIRIGETLFLICTIADVDMIDTGLVRQWTKGPELICHNGNPLDQVKYREILTKQNQFKLQINNVTESDLQCIYQCRYSFETQTKKIEISKHNFEYPPANDTKAIIHYNVSDGTTYIELHLEKVYPMPICTVTVRDLRMPFDIVKYRKYNISNDVDMVAILPNSIKCIEDVEVTCQLIKKYSFAVENKEMCKSRGDSKIDLIALLVGLLTPAIIVSLIAIGFLKLKAFRKKRKLKEKEEDVRRNQNPVDKDLKQKQGEPFLPSEEGSLLEEVLCKYKLDNEEIKRLDET